MKTKLTSAFLLLAATVAAQMTITNVTNAGSRQPGFTASGLNIATIAYGAGYTLNLKYQ